MYRPMHGRHFRFTREFAADAIRKAKFDNPNLRRTAIPPEWVLLNRLQWGLFSVLGRLNAEGDFATPFWDAIDGPTEIVQRPAISPGVAHGAMR